jgi:hypothetical protein
MPEGYDVVVVTVCYRRSEVGEDERSGAVVGCLLGEERVGTGDTSESNVSFDYTTTTAHGFDSPLAWGYFRSPQTTAVVS